MRLRKTSETSRLAALATLAALLAIVIGTTRTARAQEQVAAQGSHQVQQGESLDTIARQYYLAPRQLQYFNSITDPEDVAAGQQLAIPPNNLRVPADWREQLIAGRVLGEDESLHTVVKGETLAGIAQRYGFTAAQLQRANRLSDPDHLENGDNLLIPAGGNGTIPDRPAARAATRAPQQLIHIDRETARSMGVYVVIRGDTLFSIAQQFGVDVEPLQFLNNIENPNQIEVGDRLLIPDPAMVIPPPPPASPYTFMWPLDEYEVWSEFGTRGRSEHRGMDLAAPERTPIRASADGEVVFAGDQGDYGLVIILQHDDETRTVYSHNSKNLVRRGQRVTQGQYIATVGRTGNATGFHVHFEFQRNGESLDPRKHIETHQR